MTRPDLDAIRARCEAAAPGPWNVSTLTYPNGTTVVESITCVSEPQWSDYGEGEGEWFTDTLTLVETDSGVYGPTMPDAQFIAAARTDIPALLAYIDTLEHMLAEERENVDTLRARVAELEGETSMLREQISVRIEDVSMFKRLYEEQIQDDNAARAELEAEVVILRHRDALLKRVHGALADMCCRVPTSIDEPVDAIIRLSLARANQRFVDEYDLRVSAQDWANDLRAELFDWQHAVEYVLGDNWCSADGHDAKAARKALAEWAAKAQGEAPQLLAEITELKARIAVLEAMR